MYILLGSVAYCCLDIFGWLLGPHALPLVDNDGGAPETLSNIAAENRYGTFYTEKPGLLICLVPSGSSGKLNDHMTEKIYGQYERDFRRHQVEQENCCACWKGADNVVPEGPSSCAWKRLCSWQRTAFRPTVQSYERTRPIAGKMLTHADTLFGWNGHPYC